MYVNRDPEAVAHYREHAEWGEFEVVIQKDGEKIGTLDQTFSNDYDANMAARDNQIPDVGVTASVNRVDEEPDQRVPRL